MLLFFIESIISFSFFSLIHQYFYSVPLNIQTKFDRLLFHPGGQMKFQWTFTKLFEPLSNFFFIILFIYWVFIVVYRPRYRTNTKNANELRTSPIRFVTCFIFRFYFSFYSFRGSNSNKKCLSNDETRWNLIWNVNSLETDATIWLRMDCV